MTRLLDGAELAGFIKQRQLKQIRNLRQEHGISPKIVIIMSDKSSDVIKMYVSLKQKYAEDIEAEVEVVECSQADMPAAIADANVNKLVQAIVVQLPLDDPSGTDEVVNLIAPEKDVDGLGSMSSYLSATAEAIDWLLTGYNIELSGKPITIVGQGRLVGKPLYELWSGRGLDVTALDENSSDIGKVLSASQVIVSATGVSGLIKSSQIPERAVLVDAGTSSEGGKIVGDIEAKVRKRSDLIITPEKGGVGPLTIAVMFDHLIRASLVLAGKL